jgi:hypothetical protein
MMKKNDDDDDDGGGGGAAGGGALQLHIRLQQLALERGVSADIPIIIIIINSSPTGSPWQCHSRPAP